MSSAKPTRYSLAPKALNDFEEAWRYTAETWSIQQADLYIDQLTGVFETLVSAPALGREWTEFTPPVRIHPLKHHMIVYVVTDDAVVIIRILGGSQNWRAILQAIET
jgi:toxin ParE1/3/4